MLHFFTAYFFVLLPMAVMDAFWLVTMTSRFYRPLLGSLLSTSPALIPAFLFYLMYGAGVTFFVVLPAIHMQQSLFTVGIMGALLGLFAYGTYDLTNQATIQNWSWTVTIVDLLWGGFLTGTASLVAVSLYRLFGR